MSKTYRENSAEKSIFKKIDRNLEREAIEKRYGLFDQLRLEERRKEAIKEDKLIKKKERKDLTQNYSPRAFFQGLKRDKIKLENLQEEYALLFKEIQKLIKEEAQKRIEEIKLEESIFDKSIQDIKKNNNKYQHKTDKIHQQIKTIQDQLSEKSIYLKVLEKEIKRLLKVVDPKKNFEMFINFKINY